MTVEYRIVWSAKALADIGDIARFLQRKSSTAAERAVATITVAADTLRIFPESGRPYSRAPDRYRELVVPFGREGFVILYRIMSNHVRLSGVKHQREAGC